MAKNKTQAIGPQPDGSRRRSHVLRLTRRLAAPRERVFRAFTDMAELGKWWGPQGFSCPRMEIDARPGGRYRLEMKGPDGDIHVVFGEYRIVRPPEQLSFTWAWEGGEAATPTMVTLTFVARGEQTDLELMHELFPDAEMRDEHGIGWSSSFDRLEALMTGGGK